MEEKIFINGIEYRYVKIRNRGKYISKDGEGINPYRRNQKCTVHYNPDGYPCFGGGIPVHLYVAHAWVDGYFNGAEVNHKDFDRRNCKSENLEWVTHQENISYSVKYNYNQICQSKTGSKNGRAIFTENEVLLIRQLYEKGKTIADIVKVFHPELQTAKQYKSIYSTFSNIIYRKTWKHL